MKNDTPEFVAVKNDSEIKDDTRIIYTHFSESSTQSMSAISRRDNTLVFVTFVILGAGTLIFWNALLLYIHSIFDNAIDTETPNNIKPYMVHTLGATYVSFALLATIFVIQLKCLKLYLLYCGCCGLIISSFCIPFICTVFKGYFSIACLHIISAIAGSCSALFQWAMFTLASSLPRNYMGASCLGMGLSGLFSFVTWLILSEVLFTLRNGDILKAIWTHTGLVIVLLFFGILLTPTILKLPWVKCALPADRKKIVTKEIDCRVTDIVHDKKCFPSKSRIFLWTVFKQVSEQVFNISFTLWLTLMMFPGIVPYKWSMKKTQTDILVGMFQIGDFVGRYIPNLRRWVPGIILKPHLVKYVAISRVLFMPLIILRSHLTTDQLGWFAAFWFELLYVFLFAISSGWICSLSSMYLLDCVEDRPAKHLATNIHLICLLIGTSTGAWMSYLW